MTILSIRTGLNTGSLTFWSMKVQFKTPSKHTFAKSSCFVPNTLIWSKLHVPYQMGGHIPFCTLHKLEAYEANCGLHQLGLHTYTSTSKNLEDLIDAQVLRALKKGGLAHGSRKAPISRPSRTSIEASFKRCVWNKFPHQTSQRMLSCTGLKLVLDWRKLSIETWRNMKLRFQTSPIEITSSNNVI